MSENLDDFALPNNDLTPRGERAYVAALVYRKCKITWGDGRGVYIGEFFVNVDKLVGRVRPELEKQAKEIIELAQDT